MVKKTDSEQDEYQRVSGDGTKNRSEAILEMFDATGDIDKLAQRTDLNAKEISTFALMKSLMDMMNPEEERLFPIVWLSNTMGMKVSLNRKGRTELKDIAAVKAEVEEYEDAVKG